MRSAAIRCVVTVGATAAVIGALAAAPASAAGTRTQLLSAPKGACSKGATAGTGRMTKSYVVVSESAAKQVRATVTLVKMPATTSFLIGIVETPNANSCRPITERSITTDAAGSASLTLSAKAQAGKAGAYIVAYESSSSGMIGFFATVRVPITS